MRLYIASKHQDKAFRLQTLLTNDGHKITARWISCDNKFNGGRYTRKERRALALMDEADVRAAKDGLILIADKLKLNLSGGKHVETGIAIALGYPVYVIGKEENVFHFHPLVTVFPTIKALRTYLLRRR